MTIFEPIRQFNRLTMYNWQYKDWPHFKYTLSGIEEPLFDFATETGHVSGILKAVPTASQIEAILDTMVSEAMKTSEIEGEYLSRPDVVSSIRNHMGLNKTHDNIKDKRAKGAGELMVAVRNTFAEPLTEAMLFGWHKLLLGHNKKASIVIGGWRKHKEPMQVVSGAIIGKEIIHFEAPPSSSVAAEMQLFIDWFNSTAPNSKKAIKKAPVRAAIAHLYFESIHPFQDGNGRIGRAIAEKALSQTLGRPVLLSLSQTIEADKKSYYASLEKAQRNLEITKWIKYFVQVVLDAQIQAKERIDFTLKKAKYFDQFKAQCNERQLKVIKKMFAVGSEGFEGGMSPKKYMSITKTSKATATRDLQLLAEVGAMLVEGGGRSTRYHLAI